MRCEGWTRNGGVFTFGPVEWVQCPNEAVVQLTVKQKEKNGEYSTTVQPACIGCWNEAKNWPIEILAVEPLTPTPA